jgi:hypothetical protein
MFKLSDAIKVLAGPPLAVDRQAPASLPVPSPSRGVLLA